MTRNKINMLSGFEVAKRVFMFLGLSSFLAVWAVLAVYGLTCCLDKF